MPSSIAAVRRSFLAEQPSACAGVGAMLSAGPVMAGLSGATSPGGATAPIKDATISVGGVIPTPTNASIKRGKSIIID